MRINKLRELIDADKPSFGMNVTVDSPDVVEIIGKTGLVDYIEFEAEYMPYSLHSLDNLARGTELYGMTSMIKIDKENQGFTASRALGSGFQNILFTDTKNVSDAEKCVAAVRPDGNSELGNFSSADRRFSSYGLESGTKEYVKYLNDSVIALMIEKKGAIENLREILSVSGVDMIVFGGNDYSMSLGKPGFVRTNPKEVKKVELEVIKIAIEMGVTPRPSIGSPEQVAQYMELGVKHFCMGNDLINLYRWVTENFEQVRMLVEKG